MDKAWNDCSADEKCERLLLKIEALEHLIHDKEQAAQQKIIADHNEIIAAMTQDV